MFYKYFIKQKNKKLYKQIKLKSFFKFDETAIELDEYLGDSIKYYFIMVILVVIYYLICILCPYPWTLYDDLLDKKGRGVSWKAHIIYGIFAIITMLYEVFLVSRTLKKIKHLIPGMRLGC
jgi:hypothetical protein